MSDESELLELSAESGLPGSYVGRERANRELCRQRAGYQGVMSAESGLPGSYVGRERATRELCRQRVRYQEVILAESR